MDLTIIANAVVLIGAVVVAITQIIKFIKRPSRLIKKKIHDNEIKEQQVRRKEIIDCSQEVVDNAVNEAYTRFDYKLEEIKNINLHQTEEMKKLTRSSNDLLRQKITDIYYKYKDERRLPRYISENLHELFSDYDAQGGNKYIHKMYARMENWEVFDNDEDAMI